MAVTGCPGLFGDNKKIPPQSLHQFAGEMHVRRAGRDMRFPSLVGNNLRNQQR